MQLSSGVQLDTSRVSVANELNKRPNLKTFKLANFF